MAPSPPAPLARCGELALGEPEAMGCPISQVASPRYASNPFAAHRRPLCLLWTVSRHGPSMAKCMTTVGLGFQERMSYLLEQGCGSVCCLSFTLPWCNAWVVLGSGGGEHGGTRTLTQLPMILQGFTTRMLKPEAYKSHVAEGAQWPGPHSAGSGQGSCTHLLPQYMP